MTLALFGASFVEGVIYPYAYRDLHLTPGELGLAFTIGGLAGFPGVWLGPRLVRAVGVGPALVIGVALTLLESRERFGRFIPSPTAIGLGMLIPGFAIIPMVIGGIVQFVWQKVSPKTEQVYNTPLASGFITGEALVLLVLAAAAFK